MRKTPETWMTRAHAVLRAVLRVSAVLFLISGSAYAQDYGNITGLKLSSDLRTLIVRSDAPLGKHYAYVIDDPHRLVIDFESSGLGRLARKLSINTPPVREIRLGLTTSRARVVVDFGENAVPSYQIHRKENRVAIVFGRGVKRPPGAAKPMARKKSPKKKRKPRKPTPRIAIQDNNPHLSLRSAGLSDDLLFVELVDRNDPNRRYRLVLDLDINQVKVGQVSVSDAHGNVQCFKVMETEVVSPGIKARARVLPRKSLKPAVAEANIHAKRKFDWGKIFGRKSEKRSNGPSVQKRQRDSSSLRVKQRGPTLGG